MIVISFALLLNVRFTVRVFSDKLCKVLTVLMQRCRTMDEVAPRL